MKLKNKILILLITAILFTSSMSMAVNKIDYTQTEGSLTIIKKAKEDGQDNNLAKPLAGVTFRIYKVDDDETDTTDDAISEYTALSSWDYENPGNNSQIDSDGTLYATEKVTGSNGEAKFEKLPLGRYLVKETSVPANIKGKIDPFLIDIPYTDDNGTSLNYNPTVTPKNVIVYAKVTLTNTGNEESLLKGVQYELEKKGVGGVWEKVTDKGALETNDSGQIVIEGLDIGEYRLIQKSLGTDSSTQGYILDNSVTHDFTVTAVDGEISVDNETIKVTNEKPVIDKTIEDTVVNSKSENAKKDENKKSANIGDTIKYKVTLSVPELINKLTTYKIKDTLNSNLKLDSENIKVVGTKRDSGDTTESLQAEEDYTLSNQTETGYEIEFVNSKLVNYSKLDITYSAEIKESASFVSGGYENNVTLMYSSAVKENYDSTPNEADVLKDITLNKQIVISSGGFKIVKKAGSDAGEALEGAEFKIADSEVNAKNGIFIKNSKGEEIKITSGAEGKGEYFGLSFGDYWLVETQAPKVKDSDKYYNLLKEPVQIKIDADSYNDAKATIVVNKKGTILPETGGIGTLIFTVSGIALIVIGIIIYKKNNKEEKK